jgi:hypothetical protein
MSFSHLSRVLASMACSTVFTAYGCRILRNPRLSFSESAVHQALHAAKLQTLQRERDGVGRRAVSSAGNTHPFPEPDNRERDTRASKLAFHAYGGSHAHGDINRLQQCLQQFSCQALEGTNPFDDKCCSPSPSAAVPFRRRVGSGGGQQPNRQAQTRGFEYSVSHPGRLRVTTLDATERRAPYGGKSPFLDPVRCHDSKWRESDRALSWLNFVAERMSRRAGDQQRTGESTVLEGVRQGD